VVVGGGAYLFLTAADNEGKIPAPSGTGER